MVHPAVVAPDGGGASSGFLLLGEVEDLAVGLPQVLLLFEVHLKRPLDGHKGNTSLEEEEKQNKKQSVSKDGLKTDSVQYFKASQRLRRSSRFHDNSRSHRHTQTEQIF